MAGLPGSNRLRPACSRSRAARLRSPMRTQKSACSAPKPRSNRMASRSSSRGASMIGADLRQCDALVHGAIILRQAKRDPLIPPGFGDAFRCEGPDSSMRFEGNAATRRHGRNGLRRLDEPHRLAMVARKFGDGAEGAEAPLRLGIGYFPLQEVDGRGAHRSHRNGSGSGMEKHSPGQWAKGEYRLVRSGQAGPAGGRTGRCGQNVAPAFTM